MRPKTCIKCGTELPSKLVYPKSKGNREWYVREIDPITGKKKDLACPSAQAADALIAQLERDWSPDPVRTALIEELSVIVRQVEAATRDDIVNVLIERLGGSAAERTLEPIGWQEAIDIICEEMKQQGDSTSHIEDTRLVCNDLQDITGIDEWKDISLDAIGKFRAARLSGDYTPRAGRRLRPVKPVSVNGDMRVLCAYLNRLVLKRWIVRNPLEKAAGVLCKVAQCRVRYLPDSDLDTLIEAAPDTWWRSLILVAYYTAARRNDLLALEWTDIDLDGTMSKDGADRIGPHIYIRGAKADTAHWMPLHPDAVEALKRLRAEPRIDRLVFPVVATAKNKGALVSTRFATLCCRAGLTVEAVDRKGRTYTKNAWSLHSLRKKANTDLRNAGASPKERAGLLGHRSVEVNEQHYESLLPSRERSLIDALPSRGIKTA